MLGHRKRVAELCENQEKTPLKDPSLPTLGCCLASHENQEKINFFWVNHSVYFVMAVYEGGYASFTQ